MHENDQDRALIDFVNRCINEGRRGITLPGSLVANASFDALDEVRRLCRLNGVTLEINA